MHNTLYFRKTPLAGKYVVNTAGFGLEIMRPTSFRANDYVAAHADYARRNEEYEPPANILLLKDLVKLVEVGQLDLIMG